VLFLVLVLRNSDGITRIMYNVIHHGCTLLIIKYPMGEFKTTLLRVGFCILSSQNYVKKDTFGWILKHFEIKKYVN
jgi:hypothetical protein